MPRSILQDWLSKQALASNSTRQSPPVIICSCYLDVLTESSKYQSEFDFTFLKEITPETACIPDNESTRPRLSRQNKEECLYSLHLRSRVHLRSLSLCGTSQLRFNLHQPNLPSLQSSRASRIGYYCQKCLALAQNVSQNSSRRQATSPIRRR